jgi:tetratricopeptide (TPR) repeat protein
MAAVVSGERRRRNPDGLVARGRSRRSTISLCVALSWGGAWLGRPALALREPDDRWIEVRTERLVLVGDIPESQGRTLVVQLERLRHVLAGVAPGLHAESSPPMSVYVFGEDASFASYARKQGVDRGVGGLSYGGADGDFILVNAGGEGHAFGVLYHEYLHRVVVDSFPALPLCLNEGLAEFFGTFWTNGYEAEIGAPIAEHLEVLARGELLPLATLFEVTPQSAAYTDPAAKRLFHAESWLLVHYLLQGHPELRDAIPRCLQAVREGGAATSTFQAIVGIDLATLEAELETYLRKGIFPISTVDFAEPFPSSAVAVREMAERDVHFRLGLLLANGRPEGYAAAERHFECALALDPDDSASLAEMAKLRQRQGRPAAAAAYARMVEAVALVSRGETAAASRVLREALAEAPDPAERRRLQARIRRMEQNTD